MPSPLRFASTQITAKFIQVSLKQPKSSSQAYPFIEFIGGKKKRSRFILVCLLGVGATRVGGQFVTIGHKDPIFQVTQWLESDDYDWKSFRDTDAGLVFNSSVLIIPGDIVGLILECNASYPVEITFQMDENFDAENFMLLFSIHTKARREVKSLEDQSSYEYSMRYQIFATSNQATGVYVCRGTSNTDYQSKLYIMWEGSSPPYLIGAKSTTTVSTHKKEQIILACRVSAPDIDVLLEKQVNITKENNETVMEFTALDTNDSIIFDPTYGFLMKMNQLSDVEGLYRCSTYELDDELYINVTSEPFSSTNDNDKMISHTTFGSQAATLSYQSNDSSLVCCSNSRFPPKLLFFTCPTPTVCKMIKTAVIRYADILSSLRRFSHHSNNNNCSQEYVYGYSGLAVCKGDGINTAVEVFFPVERYPNESRFEDIYLRWSDAVPEKLIRIHALNVTRYYYAQEYPGKEYFYDSEDPWPFETPMYAGQNVTFRCEASTYYYASGIKWQVGWKNNTNQLLDCLDIGEDVNLYYWGQSNPVSIILHTQMNAIICFAPVWNSSDWVQKRFPLNISEPTSPTIQVLSSDGYKYWTLNETDKSIECKSEGEPTPYMFWEKHSEALNSDDNVKVETPENGTLVLRFTIATHDVHGDYTCVSTNIAGTNRMTVTVMIEEPHPLIATIVITLIVLVLILVLGFLAWRIKIQQNVADAIRRNEFQQSQEHD